MTSTYGRIGISSIFQIDIYTFGYSPKTVSLKESDIRKARFIKMVVSSNRPSRLVGKRSKINIKNPAI